MSRVCLASDQPPVTNDGDGEWLLLLEETAAVGCSDGSISPSPLVSRRLRAGNASYLPSPPSPPSHSSSSGQHSPDTTSVTELSLGTGTVLWSFLLTLETTSHATSHVTSHTTSHTASKSHWRTLRCPVHSKRVTLRTIHRAKVRSLLVPTPPHSSPLLPTSPQSFPLLPTPPQSSSPGLAGGHC